METLIRVLKGYDGRTKASVFERPDGLFTYECEWLVEDDPELEPYWRRYDAPSGLYATADEAEADAITAYPSLRPPVSH